MTVYGLMSYLQDKTHRKKKKTQDFTIEIEIE